MDPRNLMMGLEAAADQAALLTSLALAIVGGSIITLLQTSYLRPKNRYHRAGYLFFLPGWYFLGESIYHGSRVRAVHLSYLFSPKNAQVDFAMEAGRDAAAQSSSLFCGLLMFTIWLSLYLAWWIYTDDPVGRAPGSS